jgi:PleD family two-component response regulator
LVSSHPDTSADLLPNGSDADERSRPRGKDKNGDLYCPGEVRILVVDDDEQICRLIQATLASEAFTVDAVSEPAEIEVRIKDRSARAIW